MSIFAQRINHYTPLIVGMQIKIVDIRKVRVKDSTINGVNNKMK